MSRRPLPKFSPNDLSSQQRDLLEAIAGGRRANGPFRLVDGQGALEGPFNAMLLSPAIGHPLQALGSAIRYESSLSDRSREIAILTVAAHWDSQFERYAHEAVGLTIGLEPGLMTALRTGDHSKLDGVDLLVATTTAQLANGGLTDLQFEQAMAALSPAGLFELTTLTGYYATLALVLRTFGDAVPAD